MIDLLRDKLGLLLGRRPTPLQIAALCLDPATAKVLLITSRGTGRWILPKGWPMNGRSLGEAAQQEAWEEAGVRGPLMRQEFGSYHYDKIQDRGFGIPVRVQVFGIEVQELCDNYPESGQRRRAWFTPVEAAELVEEPELKSLLRRLPDPSGLS